MLTIGDNKMAKSRDFKLGHDEEIGKGEFANMPKDVRMEQYPKTRHGRGDMDDTISGIDEVIDQGAERRDRYMSNQK